jgi:DnaJ-domain-containing protein 1
LARGFVSNLQQDEQLNERVRETIRNGRESGESLKSAVGAAWRGAAEEWRSSEEAGQPGVSEPEEREKKEKREKQEKRGSVGGESGRSGTGAKTGSRAGTGWLPRRYPPNVLAAYQRLGLETGSDMDEVRLKRRELVKRYHPDRFSDPEKRVKAERLTAQINAAHDTIRRHSTRSL